MKDSEKHTGNVSAGFTFDDLKECLRLEVISRDGKRDFSWLRTFHRVITNDSRRFYFWWRIASYWHHNKTGFLKSRARKINKKLIRKYQIEIALDALIGPGMKINHGIGIVIRPECIIGKGLNIRQGVCIGRKRNGDTSGMTRIGDFADIGVSAIIIGDVNIGENVTIGAASFVNTDVPDNSVVHNKVISVIKSKHAV